jgi:hypothetical protein
VDLTRARWQKSSFSNGSSGQDTCVEVALLPVGVALRDTKNRALPPHLFGASEWTAFLAAVRLGQFSRP